MSTSPTPPLELIIRGESFACRRVSTTWQMMQFAEARRKAAIVIPKGLPKDSPKYRELSDKRNEAGMDMLSTMLNTALALLKPEERDRFRQHMDELSMSEQGLDNGELEAAISETIGRASNPDDDGTDPKSLPDGGTTPVQSSNGDTTISGNVEVVSLTGDMPTDKQPAQISSTQ